MKQATVRKRRKLKVIRTTEVHLNDHQIGSGIFRVEVIEENDSRVKFRRPAIPWPRGVDGKKDPRKPHTEASRCYTLSAREFHKQERHPFEETGE